MLRYDAGATRDTSIVMHFFPTSFFDYAPVKFGQCVALPAQSALCRPSEPQRPRSRYGQPPAWPRVYQRTALPPKHACLLIMSKAFGSSVGTQLIKFFFYFLILKLDNTCLITTAHLLN